MENQERLKQAGVLDPHGELTPELGDAVESLTPEEVEDLISGRGGLSAASADRPGDSAEGPPEDAEDESHRPQIFARPPDKDKHEKEHSGPEIIFAHPTPGPDEDDDKDDDKDRGGKGGGSR